MKEVGLGLELAGRVDLLLEQKDGVAEGVSGVIVRMAMKLRPLLQTSPDTEVDRRLRRLATRRPRGRGLHKAMLGSFFAFCPSFDDFGTIPIRNGYWVMFL